MDLQTLLPQFGSGLVTILAFIVALSVIVAIHEYGHYIVGRWSGIKAEVFSLGFGPVLFSRMDRHGTRWQVAALPFGGYVKFLGDADAASGKDSDAMAQVPAERLRQTMHGAPLWARTATVAAGPIFNFILSILIFTAVMMAGGKTADPLTVGALKPLPVEGVTLQPGDEVLAVADMALPEVGSGGIDDAFLRDLPTRSLLDYEVRRDGRRTSAQGPHIMPPLVGGLSPQSAAFDAGLRVGDVITAVNDQPVHAFSELKEIVEGSNGASLALDMWRPDSGAYSTTLTPRRVDEPQPDGGFRTEWRIGIAGAMAFEPATEARGPVEAVGAAVAQTWQIITSSLSGLYAMITGAISSCNMSGPIGIAEVSGAMASQGAQSFIWFIAVLSTAVGLLNLFPVPVLDGGHLMFYAYEALTGRPPSDRALRFLMTVGLTLILSLMVFAVFNDLFCP
ncbi:RIP metalloprotease RseP [Roseovarius tibetensis]|uniref:RIP metalloprotease RseP n=1 Tax=Roseovarius tibetensis TaxID=2685897 RepID=UPI003D7FA1E0